MSPEIDFKDINKAAKCPGGKEWLMPELCPISLPLVLGTEKAEALPQAWPNHALSKGWPRSHPKVPSKLFFSPVIIMTVTSLNFKCTESCTLELEYSGLCVCAGPDLLQQWKTQCF